MSNQCRVYREELENDLQDAARSQINAETFENLDVQICDECSDQFPATEFKYDGICEGCAEWGHCPDEHTFVSETGHYYKI